MYIYIKQIHYLTFCKVIFHINSKIITVKIFLLVYCFKSTNKILTLFQFFIAIIFMNNFKL